MINAALLALAIAAPSGSLGPGPTRILFIGNSYTYYHDLPEILTSLGRQARPSRAIETDRVVVGGATLRDHWSDGVALAKIREGHWDYVVLQEQSSLGLTALNGAARINDPAMYHRFARLFDAEIRRAGARTVIYHTWAPKDHPDDQPALDAAFVPFSKEIDAVLAPVGIAWQRVRRERPDLELYDADGRHPGPAGSYLAACTIWAALFGETPVGLAALATGEGGSKPLVSLRPADALVLQRAAWAARNDVLRGTTTGAAAGRVVPDALPAGRRFEPRELEGVWTGPLELYLGSGTASLELRRSGEDWKVDWGEDVTFGEKRHRFELLVFGATVTDSTLGFEAYDPRVIGIPERHWAVLVGDTLVGRAEVGDSSKAPHFAGRWKLVRRP
jgi:hypothetical protein